MRSATQTSHLVLTSVETGHQPRLQCENCGTTFHVSMPTRLSMLFAMAKCFEKEHWNCQARKADA